MLAALFPFSHILLNFTPSKVVANQGDDFAVNGHRTINEKSETTRR